MKTVWAYNIIKAERLSRTSTSTDRESPHPPPPPPPCVCMSIQPEDKSRSDLGPVLVRNDPPAPFTLKTSHAPISVKCVYLRALLHGAAGEREGLLH